MFFVLIQMARLELPFAPALEHVFGLSEHEKVKRNLNQRIELGDADALNLSFRMRKSPDYDGEPILIRFVRPDKTTTDYTRTVEGSGWSQIKIDYDEVKSDEVTLAVFVRKARSGYIELDDFDLKQR